MVTALASYSPAQDTTALPHPVNFDMAVMEMKTILAAASYLKANEIANSTLLPLIKEGTTYLNELGLRPLKNNIVAIAEMKQAIVVQRNITDVCSAGLKKLVQQSRDLDNEYRNADSQNDKVSGAVGAVAGTITAMLLGSAIWAAHNRGLLCWFPRITQYDAL